jgi:putative PIN family toxin of toxin-antitoxin system
MNRVVLDTNVIVSATLVPSGTQASVLLLALRGDLKLCLSEPVFSEYEEVLQRPRFKLHPRQIHAVLRDIRKAALFVRPAGKLAASSDESDNRLLECAHAARADYLVTGNLRHFPTAYKMTKIVTGRRLLDIVAAQQSGERA